MKYIYSILILLFFFGCKVSKSNKEENITKKPFLDAIEEAVHIAEKNKLEPLIISVTFANDNLYLNVSESPLECFFTAYEFFNVSINSKNYYVIFNQNHPILKDKIDVSKLISVKERQPTIICCETKGYFMRFEKSNTNYKLKALANSFEENDHVMLENDKTFFPNYIEIIPEPEPTK